MKKAFMNCKTILVVEDDRDIRESVEDVLRTEGYEVFAAANGKEAISILREIEHPTLILLDMMMPVMSGWEFLEAQKSSAQFANLPVVVVSAQADESALISKRGDIQAEGLLRKPIQLENLLSVVETYCENPEVVRARESESLATA